MKRSSAGNSRDLSQRFGLRKVYLHSASQFVETFVLVLILDDEVPQLVELEDLVKIVHRLVAKDLEMVIEVPQTSLLDLIPQRRGLWEPQLAEELGGISQGFS